MQGSFITIDKQQVPFIDINSQHQTIGSILTLQTHDELRILNVILKSRIFFIIDKLCEMKTSMSIKDSSTLHKCFSTDNRKAENNEPGKNVPVKMSR